MKKRTWPPAWGCPAGQAQGAAGAAHGGHRHPASGTARAPHPCLAVLACTHDHDRLPASGGVLPLPLRALPVPLPPAGCQPLPMDATEDVRAFWPQLRTPSGGPVSSDARRRFFSSGRNREGLLYDTRRIYTFHFWQQFVDLATYQLDFAYSYDLARHLDGQPLQVRASAHAQQGAEGAQGRWAMGAACPFDWDAHAHLQARILGGGRQSMAGSSPVPAALPFACQRLACRAPCCLRNRPRCSLVFLRPLGWALPNPFDASQQNKENPKDEESAKPLTPNQHQTAPKGAHCCCGAPGAS